MAQQILSTNTFTTAKWIVSATASDGTHTTIGAALTSASSGDTIFIRPGTYTENITLKAGVNLSSQGSDGAAAGLGTNDAPNVIIKGSVTVTFTGDVTLFGIQFEDNGSGTIATSGSNAGNLILNTCSVYANGSTGMTFNNVNMGVSFYSCTFNSTGSNLLFAVTTGSVNFQDCLISLSATAAASTIATSNVNFFNCTLEGLDITTTTTGSVTANACYWSYGGNTLLTTAGTGTSSIYNCALASTTASTISVGTGTTVNIANSSVSSSNTHTITGAGTLNYANIVFTSSSYNINTTTVNPYTVSSPILTDTGSVNNPAYSFAARVSAGMYLTGTSLAFGNTGSQAMYIDLADTVHIVTQLSNPATSVLNGALIIAYHATAISYSATSTDNIIAVTDNTSARTITLQAVTTTGRLITVKDQAGTAQSGNNITVSVASAGTIDGASSVVINTNYGSLSFYFNGSQWNII